MTALKPSQTQKVWLAFEHGLGVICAVVLLCMMSLTGVDVIARYVLNAPIQGAFELTEVLLVFLVFCAMPLTTRTGGHIEVELWEPTSRAGNGLRLFLASLCGLTVFGGLAYQLTEHAQRLAKYGSVTNSLNIPLTYIAYVAAACCAISALAVLLTALRKI
ncbi:MAG: TRAP transporter small permease [Sulfitobacter sp.]